MTNIHFLRLLMNLILMRAGFPPVIIRRADRFENFQQMRWWIILNLFREVYYRHLQTANEGDVRPFIRLPSLLVQSLLNCLCAAGL